MIEKTELEKSIDALIKNKEDKEILNRNLLNMRLEIYTLNKKTKRPERISILEELIIKFLYYIGYSSFNSLANIFHPICDEEELKVILKKLSVLDEEEKVEGKDLRKKILRKDELKALKDTFNDKELNDISITDDILKIINKAIEELSKREESKKEVVIKDYLLHKEENEFFGDIYILSSKTIKEIEKTNHPKMYDIPRTSEALSLNKLRCDYFTEKIMNASLIELEKIWDTISDKEKVFYLTKCFIKYISGDEFFKKDKKQREEFLKGLKDKKIYSLTRATNIDEDIRKSYSEVILKIPNKKDYILKIDKLNTFIKSASTIKDKRIKYYLLHDLIKQTNSQKKFLSIIQNTLFGEFSNLLYSNNNELRDKIANLCNDVIKENNLDECDYPETFSIHNEIERLQRLKAVVADIGKNKRNRKMKIIELNKVGKYAKIEADELDAINKDLEIINKTIKGLEKSIKEEQDKIRFYNPKKSINSKEKQENKNPCITFETMISNKIYVENAYVKNRKLVIDLVGFDASGNYDTSTALKKIFGPNEMLKSLIKGTGESKQENINYILVNYKLVYSNASNSVKYDALCESISLDKITGKVIIAKPNKVNAIAVKDFLNKSEYIKKII
ncbi:MAG: hypothetical protein K0R00_2800 [Herbinix sp.]|jgi:hypothetical protein|nr:hypothetical protein [Herbinix sp.]